jgi:hypothetical protein
MSSNVKNDSKPSHDEAVTKAVAENPGATIEGVAEQAGIGRSTAGKVLGRLAQAGEVGRHEGGRDGRKRLPDRFTLKDVELPAAYATHTDGDSASDGDTGGEPAAMPAASKPGKAKGTGSRSDKRSASRKASRAIKHSGSTKPSASGKAERLKAGELEPLVLAYLKQNKGTAPHGPSQVAKALGRSSGAVGNCLVRLTDAKKAKRVTDKPLRYDIAA